MKKAILIVLGCFGCFLVLGIVGFGLFGYIEVNNECKFRGLLTSPSEGACKKVDDSNQDVGNNKESTYTGKYSSDIGMAIPENFFIDESSEDITFIFSQDPATIEEGDFVPNLNLITSEDYLEFSASVCSDLVDASINELQPYYDSLEDWSATVQRINGVIVCVTEWNGVLDGVALLQKQFIFPDEQGRKMYYLTLTTNPQRAELEEMEDIVKSFRLK